ncbi:unnamed protein product [Angiostrongylus costaricensis]|uniref:Uncharacterized protein n=1 Tax=Angiostrongylus costaricensis TaxID=334426 RepID=A0A0R3PQC1_ANGCS|nr:unnamed protein product [Angiostrongylus costaricensis]
MSYTQCSFVDIDLPTGNLSTRDANTEYRINNICHSTKYKHISLW